MQTVNSGLNVCLPEDDECNVRILLFGDLWLRADKVVAPALHMGTRLTARLAVCISAPELAHCVQRAHDTGPEAVLDDLQSGWASWA
jgi:hypothetical protein